MKVLLSISSGGIHVNILFNRDLDMCDRCIREKISHHLLCLKQAKHSKMVFTNELEKLNTHSLLQQPAKNVKDILQALEKVITKTANEVDKMRQKEKDIVDISEKWKSQLEEQKSRFASLVKADKHRSFFYAKLDNLRSIVYSCHRCLANDINSVIQPCSHAVFCVECANKLNECPLCGIVVDDVVRINIQGVL